MDKVRAILIAFSLLLFAFLIISADPQKLVENVSGADKTYLLLSISCISLAMILRIYRWKILISELSFLEIAPIQLFGNALSNIAPAKASEPVKAMLLKSNYGISLSKGFSSTVVERMTDLIAAVLISLLVLFYIPWEIAFIPIVSFGGIVLVLVASAQSKAIQSFGVGIVARFSKGYAVSAKKFVAGLRLDRKFANACALGLLIWTLDAATAVFVFMSLGAMPDVQAPYLAVSGLMCFSLLVGLLTMLPGGLGSMDISFAVLLQGLGVEGALSVSAVILYRLLTFWSGVFIGLASSVFITKKGGME
ncbi:MAG: flippase-like domain-containing protein [Candidatus Micrarchaeota archaeon]